MLLRTNPLPLRREGPQAGHCCAHSLASGHPQPDNLLPGGAREEEKRPEPRKCQRHPQVLPTPKGAGSFQERNGGLGQKNRSQGISWDLGQAGDRSSSCPTGKGQPRPRGQGEGPPLTSHSHNDTPACSGPCVKARETQREQQESLSLGRSQPKAGLRAC